MKIHLTMLKRIQEKQQAEQQPVIVEFFEHINTFFINGENDEATTETD